MKKIIAYLLLSMLLTVFSFLDSYAGGGKEKRFLYTDEQIKRDIIDQLHGDSRIDASNIEVEVNNGEVILRGVVPTYSTLENVIDAAWMIKGVTSVESHLKIRFAFPNPPDETIEENAERVLEMSPYFDYSEIGLSVESGIVTLRGTVDNLWKKVRAEELVANIRGVLKISNQIAVVPTEDIIDESIAESIVRAIDRNANVDVDDINVKVSNGEVTLSGRVSTYIARRAAYEAAVYTIGVKDVANNIIVK